MVCFGVVAHRLSPARRPANHHNPSFGNPFKAPPLPHPDPDENPLKPHPCPTPTPRAHLHNCPILIAHRQAAGRDQLDVKYESRQLLRGHQALVAHGATQQQGQGNTPGRGEGMEERAGDREGLSGETKGNTPVGRGGVGRKGGEEVERDCVGDWGMKGPDRTWYHPTAGTGQQTWWQRVRRECSGRGVRRQTELEVKVGMQ